jgi:predicted RNA-binding protein YlxR (DUF448 family)
MENQEQTQTEQAQQDLPKVTLLSAISYQNREDYEIFLKTMTGEHAVVTLIAAANHAQGRGAYNLDEAELIAKAIRKLTVDPSTTQPTEAAAATAEPEQPAKKATRTRKK